MRPDESTLVEKLSDSSTRDSHFNTMVILVLSEQSSLSQQIVDYYQGSMTKQIRMRPVSDMRLQPAIT